jgi:hypothetical protein
MACQARGLVASPMHMAAHWLSGAPAAPIASLRALPRSLPVWPRSSLKSHLGCLAHPWRELHLRAHKMRGCSCDWSGAIVLLVIAVVYALGMLP